MPTVEAGPPLLTLGGGDFQIAVIGRRQSVSSPGCRLRTDAEWAYAAWAGRATAYAFGDDIGQLARYAWFGGAFASGSTHPVGLLCAHHKA